METITLQLPNIKYKEILSYFIINYEVKELEQIKNNIELSKKLYFDYQNDFTWQEDIWVLETSWKNKNEILYDLKNILWN